MRPTNSSSLSRMYSPLSPSSYRALKTVHPEARRFLSESLMRTRCLRVGSALVEPPDDPLAVRSFFHCSRERKRAHCILEPTIFQGRAH